MRRILSILALSVLVISTGCIKNNPRLFTELQAELDAATYNANALGVTYPIIARVPAYGRVAGTSDSTLRRFAQTVRLRVNLIGPQSSKDETVGYEVFTSPLAPPADSLAFPATITGQTPSAVAAGSGTVPKLKVINAVSGTDYGTLSGTVTIPAKSSFGYIDVPILTTGPTAGTAKFLGIRLNNKGSVKQSVNYSEVGLLIDQR